MLKLVFILSILLLSSVTFSQDDIKPCGQLTQLNPTDNPVCENDIQRVISDSLPLMFKEEVKYESTFKLLIDCNGRIDMVIYKNGNIDTAKQKHFLLLLNKLKAWKAAQLNDVDVSAAVYLSIHITDRQLTIKQY